MSALIWYVFGVLSGVAAAVLAPQLRRASAASGAPRASRYLLPAGALAIFALAVVAIYVTIGAPITSPAGARALEDAAAGLATRLAGRGGSADEWELLAKSYDFLGRPADAQRAREQAQDVTRSKDGTAERPAETSVATRPTAGASSDLSPASAALIASQLDSRH